MIKQVFKAIVLNDEEYYIKTLESLVLTYPKIFYDAVVSERGEIGVSEFVRSWNDDFRVTVKANLWFWKKEYNRCTLEIDIKVYISKTDFFEIVPYVQNGCRNKLVSYLMKMEVGIHELKQGSWFDKIMEKGKDVRININIGYPSFFRETVSEGFQKFFENILRRLETDNSVQNFS